MEKREETPTPQIEDFWPPRDLLARSLYRLDAARGGVDSMLNFLRTQDIPQVSVPHSEKVLTPTLREAKEYAQSEVNFVERHYPDGYRYNSTAERFRRDAKILEKALRENDDIPLIRYFLDKSLKESRIGKRAFERIQKMTQKERFMLEKSREESVEALEKFKKTNDHGELGLPPEFFESGIESFARSRLFLGYAICLAKEV